jgi:hypothetical protein
MASTSPSCTTLTVASWSGGVNTFPPLTVVGCLL